MFRILAVLFPLLLPGMAWSQSAPPPAPVTVGSAEPAPIPVPQQIRDDIVSLAVALITGMTGIALTWMRAHLRIMQDATMNRTITDSANGFAALLVQKIQARGEATTTLDVHNPEVYALATSMISRYPDFTKALGLTPDVASSIILKEIAKVVTATNPTPGVAVEHPDEAAQPAKVEAVAPTWPKQGAAA